jgi:glycosyltransferase involved in cell wall biosynthesis
MIVKNEENRFLKEVLEKASEWADVIIILDDKSTDKTPEICKSFPKVQFNDSPFDQSMFSIDESRLRSYLWSLVRKVAVEGDWCVSLDADEIFEDNFKEESRKLMELKNINWISFKLADMWDKDHYRVDGYWSPLITRMYPYKNVEFGLVGKLHCGCVPKYAMESTMGTAASHIRLKHLGWQNDEDKSRKAKFYLENAEGINYNHALTIMQPATLKKFEYPRKYGKVLVSSLIRNREWVIGDFLKGLESIDYEPELLHFYFIVNDSEDATKKILEDWGEKNDGKYGLIAIEEMNFQNTPHLEHHWEDKRIHNMSVMRNRVLERVVVDGYEGTFMLDSDIIIKHPQLMKHLIHLDRDMVSEVFWATWGHGNAKPLPNVWNRGGYELSEGLLDMLKRPGTYIVGGNGACSYITRDAIMKGFNYRSISNLPSEMRGEDRYSMIRASVNDINLWADTFYTPEHREKDPELIKREKVMFELKQEKDFRDKVKNFKEYKDKLEKKNGISLCMIAKDEEKLIGQAILSALPIVDEVIVVDTGSKDKTPIIAEALGARVILYDGPKDENGRIKDFSHARNVSIRAAKNPWILRIDADECIPRECVFNIWKLAQVEGPVDAYLFTLRNYLEDPSKSANPKWALSETFRMFKNDPSIYYTRPVHEDIDDSLAEDFDKTGKKRTITRTNFPIFHYGYLRGGDYVKDKHEWYYTLLKKQTEDTPKDARPFLSLAIHLYFNEKFDEAIVYYKKAIELNEKLWAAWNDLGVIAFKRHKMDEAEKCFKRAKELLPEFVNPSHKKKLEENLIAIENTKRVSIAG